MIKVSRGTQLWLVAVNEAGLPGAAYWVVPGGATQSGSYQLEKAMLWVLWAPLVIQLGCWNWPWANGGNLLCGVLGNNSVWLLSAAKGYIVGFMGPLTEKIGTTQ